MRLTKPQSHTLYKKWHQSNGALTFLQFRRGVVALVGYDNPVKVRWCGRWLCIETDGDCPT